MFSLESLATIYLLIHMLLRRDSPARQCFLNFLSLLMTREHLCKDLVEFKFRPPGPGFHAREFPHPVHLAVVHDRPAVAVPSCCHVRERVVLVLDVGHPQLVMAHHLRVALLGPLRSRADKVLRRDALVAEELGARGYTDQVRSREGFPQLAVE